MKITEGTNLLKENEKKRLVLDLELQQVNFLDYRVYKRDEDLYYPSVTSVLEYMPKGRFFEQWLKDMGKEADILRDRAAKEGTQVHNIIEKLITKEEVEWMDQYGQARYSEQVWKMANKFVEFWNQVKPKSLYVEEFIFSDEHQYAGTADFVCEIEDKRWMIDFKTSNSLHRSYDLQLAAYAKAWEEQKGEKIDHTAILWLKSQKRGESKKKGVYQGAGWELKVIDDIDVNFELFQTIYKLYKLDNPTVQPIYRNYPTKLQLK